MVISANVAEDCTSPAFLAIDRAKSLPEEVEEPNGDWSTSEGFVLFSCSFIG
jgi:hypothetical protein